MTEIWSILRALDRSNRVAILALSVLAVVAGFVEAVVLVLVASSLLSITQDADENVVAVAGGAFEMSINQLLPLLFALACSVLIARTGVAWLTARVGASVLQRLRAEVITRFSRATHSRQTAERQGALQESTMNLAAQSASATLQATAFVIAAVSLVGMIAVSAMIDVLGTLAVIAAGVVIVVTLRPVQSAAKRRAREFVRSNAKFAELLTEWADIAPDLRVTGVEVVQRNELIRKSDQNVRRFRRSRFRTRLAAGLFRDVAVLLMVAFVALVLVLPRLDLAVLGGVVLIALRSLGYAQQANTTRLQVIELSPNVEELQRRLRDLAAHEESDGSRVLKSFEVLRLDGVGYRYDESERHALSGVDLEIVRGSVVGVIGPSGGGKSTLMHLLLRLRVPTEGVITVNGVDYRDVARSSWSELIGYVPQEPRLFAGTILDNVKFFRTDVSDEDAREAMRTAHIFDEVMRLPAGDETVLGPRGIGLSGGQRQRLTIARALAGRARILVMDEPTSALDQQSERRFHETIRDLRGTVTVVVVAHRLLTVESCDQVISVVDGTVQVASDLQSALRTAGIG